MSIFDEDKSITIESLEEFGFNLGHMTRWDYKVFGGKQNRKYIMTISWDERRPNKLVAHLIGKVYDVETIRDVEIIVESIKQLYQRSKYNYEHEHI